MMRKIVVLGGSYSADTWLDIVYYMNTVKIIYLFLHIENSIIHKIHILSMVNSVKYLQGAKYKAHIEHSNILINH